MAKQSFKSKAINAVLSAIVRTLLGWAEEWSKDAFFFLVIGDKTCTDVAWYNPLQLSVSGPLAISDDVEATKVFQCLCDSSGILIDDRMKEEDFCKEVSHYIPAETESGWFSYECEK